MIKKLFAVSLLITSTTTSVYATEIEANIGVTSNYLWRGVSQSDNHSSISSGITISNHGFYSGAWVGSVDFNDKTRFETNLFAGYQFENRGIDWDIGLIYYGYHRNSDLNFSEIYATGSYQNVSFGVATLLESSDQTTEFADNYYAHVGYQWQLENDLKADLKAGHYQHQHADSYQDFSLKLAKHNFTLELAKVFGLDGVDDKSVAISYQTTFEL